MTQAFPVTVGEQLDHYRIDAVVVQSTVATLLRATDLRTGRSVAIKMPRPEMEEDPAFADRFRREQEIAEALLHPGLMRPISDPGKTGPYMVMEWFEGKPLRQILDEEEKLTQERAVRIAAAMCSAVEYLHRHGIVHRDLQPRNVMVDSADRIKLIDLRGILTTGARRLTFTKISQITGKSGYESPEELKGRQGDARSDIYSLGLVLYEMLCGRLPFDDTEPSVRMIEDPIPPRTIDPTISLQLQEVIYRALERDPRNRYASARQFGSDLEHLDQVEIADRPEIRNWKKRRSSRNRRVLVYLVLILLPAMIIGLLLYFAYRR